MKTISYSNSDLNETHQIVIGFCITKAKPITWNFRPITDTMQVSLKPRLHPTSGSATNSTLFFRVVGLSVTTPITSITTGKNKQCDHNKHLKSVAGNSKQTTPKHWFPYIMHINYLVYPVHWTHHHRKGNFHLDSVWSRELGFLNMGVTHLV